MFLSIFFKCKILNSSWTIFSDFVYVILSSRIQVIKRRVIKQFVVKPFFEFFETKSAGVFAFTRNVLWKSVYYKFADIHDFVKQLDHSYNRHNYLKKMMYIFCSH